MREPVRLVYSRNAKGAGVTRLERWIEHPTIKEQMLSSLKKLLGCGGTIKDGILEFQGDHRDKLEIYLSEKGFKVKRI